MSEECLYLHYSRLDQWKLADLSKFFAQGDYWPLFRCVCRRLGLPKRRIGEDREALRHGL